MNLPYVKRSLETVFIKAVSRFMAVFRLSPPSGRESEAAFAKESLAVYGQDSLVW